MPVFWIILPFPPNPLISVFHHENKCIWNKQVAKSNWLPTCIQMHTKYLQTPPKNPVNLSVKYTPFVFLNTTNSALSFRCSHGMSQSDTWRSPSCLGRDLWCATDETVSPPLLTHVPRLCILFNLVEHSSLADSKSILKYSNRFCVPNDSPSMVLDRSWLQRCLGWSRMPPNFTKHIIWYTFLFRLFLTYLSHTSSLWNQDVQDWSEGGNTTTVHRAKPSPRRL